MTVRTCVRLSMLAWLLTLPLSGSAAAQSPGDQSAGEQTLGAPAAQFYRFAGTRWGASADETTRDLAAKGFRLEKVDEDGDLIFTGRLNAHPAVVMALLADDGLTKVLVSLPADDETALSIYREIKGVLDGEYGAPRHEVETYEYPFAEGKHVGFESAALRVGKAVIGAYWQANGEALGLNISERLVVSAHYESQGWRQEAERRVKRTGP